MNNSLFNIKGYLIFSKYEKMINSSFELLQPYFNEILTSTYSDRILGKFPTKDLVGDCRRAVLFLALIRKEMDYDTEVGDSQTTAYYIALYETESYRDYLVCRGVDSALVDDLFDIFNLNEDSIEDPEAVIPYTEPDELAGIGTMIIEGVETPFQIQQ